MSLSHVANNAVQPVNGALLEKVILGNDLAGLSSIEKVQYVKNVCDMIGLNPMTKPIQLMKFQGKEVPYFTKDATEQLRKNNKVSISKIDSKMLEGGVYVVTAYARTPDGREDSSTGVISVSGLKGDNLSNAMMKAETKAKRRVTLSICGLGFIDECEVESIPNAVKVNPYEASTVNSNDDDIKSECAIKFTEFMADIENAKTIDDLQKVFSIIKNTNFKETPELFKKLIDAKDAKKAQLSKEEFIAEYDKKTGEILETEIN